MKSASRQPEFIWRTRDTAEGKPTRAVQERKSTPPRQKLLIVDDETSNLQKLQRTFFRDFEILQAGTAEEALQLLERYPVDVIITDQKMPGMSGVELLEKSVLSRPEALRIVLTGYTELDYLMDAINLGRAHRYITKPWEPFALRQTVLQDLDHLRLKRQSRILEEQLRIAHEVQRHLFPRTLPDIPGVECVGVCQTAELIGGDYYDFLKLSSEELLLAVGDISGKGISAALLMASLQASVRSHAAFHKDSLDGMFRELNTLMLASTDDSKFASLFCGIVNSRDRTLRYVNAGHNPPLLVSVPGNEPQVEGDGAQGPAFSEIRLLEASGPVVGMFPNIRYEEQRVSLSPGDLLVIHTDGLIEGSGPDGEEYGEERLRDVVRTNRGQAARAMMNAILADVRRFRDHRELSDDLTLVVLKLN